MPFDSVPYGPVPDGAPAYAPTARPRINAPAVLDLYRVRSLCRTGRPLIAKNGFSIRLVGESRDSTVDALVTRMYRSRGYRVGRDGERRSAPQRDTVTLEALHGPTTVGTVTVNLGTGGRLNAETLYEHEIGPYRQAERRPCEFNRLAMQMDEASKEALAAIFHVGIVFAHRVFGATDLFIEVNPRHAPFYLRKLGFSLIGDERVCPRVNAPAVLLHKDLAVCADELRRLGGLRVPSNKSFYAFGLTPAEERALLDNIRRPLQTAGCSATERRRRSA